MTYALGTYRLEDAVGNILINGSGDFGGAISNLFKLTDPIFNATDTDDDGDGVNDADEALIGTNPLLVDTDGNGTDDGAEDFDNDGIDNATESDENAATTTDINPADRNSDITFNFVLNVNNNELVETIKISPNPSSNIFNLDINNFSNLSYEIINIIGQRIQKGECNNGINTISLKNEVDGLYFISIINSESNVRMIRKLIKN